jgi:N-acetylglutamate synthase-like GNAT family acetyltransferase
MTSANSEIKIRPADALDASNIVRLLKQLWLEETALPADRVNDRKAMRYVMETLEHPGRVLVAELSGRIVGVAAALVTQEPWSEESLIEVRWLYAITKSKDEILQVLLQQAEAFADEQELPLLARVFRYSGDRIDHFGGRKGYVSMGPGYMRIPLEALLSKPSSRDGGAAAVPLAAAPA